MSVLPKQTRGANMNILNKCRMKSTSHAAFVLALLAAAPFSHGSLDSDERSLARGATEDTTSQQKYRTAIREAGGGYKEWLRECDQMPAADRGACKRDAKATYDRVIAQAQLILGGRAATRQRP